MIVFGSYVSPLVAKKFCVFIEEHSCHVWWCFENAIVGVELTTAESCESVERSLLSIDIVSSDPLDSMSLPRIDMSDN